MSEGGPSRTRDALDEDFERFLSSTTEEDDDDEGNLCDDVVYQLDPDTMNLTKVHKRRRVDDEVASHLPEDDETNPDNDDHDEHTFALPRLRNRMFTFGPSSSSPLDVVLPEQLATSYGLHLWPSSPLLASYIWLNSSQFTNKRILELGSGTALPSLLCAKLSSDNRVFITDDAFNPSVLENIREAVRLNQVEKNVEVFGLTFGSFTESLSRLTQSNLDVIIGADVFFEVAIYEPLCMTISHLLDNNKAEVIIAVQDRGETWRLDECLYAWDLSAERLDCRDFLQKAAIYSSNHEEREEQRMLSRNRQTESIYLLKIAKIS